MIIAGTSAAGAWAPDRVVRRDRVLVGLAMSAAFAACAVDLYDRAALHPGEHHHLTSRLLAALFALAAGGAAWSALTDRARRDQIRRSALRLLAWGLTLLWGGQAIGYVLLGPSEQHFYGPVEQIPLLLSLPFTAVALLRLCWPTGMTVRDRRTAVLDSVVAVLAFGVVWWLGVVPRWVYPEVETVWEVVDQVTMFLLGASILVILVVSRRMGSLPFRSWSCSWAASPRRSRRTPSARRCRSPTPRARSPGRSSATPWRPGSSSPSRTGPRWRWRRDASARRASSCRSSSRSPWSCRRACSWWGRRGATARSRAPSASSPSSRWSRSCSPSWSRASRRRTSCGTCRSRRSPRCSPSAPVRGGSAPWSATRPRAWSSSTTWAGCCTRAPGSSATSRCPTRSRGSSPTSSSRPDPTTSRCCWHRCRPTRPAPGPTTSGARPRRPAARDGGGRPPRGRRRVPGFVVTARDVSDTRRLTRQLANSRRRDELTGLLSRDAFLSEVSQRLDEQDADRGVAVITLDLERFAALNDGLGHETGDRILIAVATAFERLPDVVVAAARLGSDTFALLVVDDRPEQSVGEVVEQVRFDLQGLLLSDGREVELGFHAGYVVSEPSEGRSGQWHLEAADIALARARSSRNARLVGYDTSMRLETERRIAAERRLRQALADDRLEVFYQPVVRLSDGVVTGAEALARLRGTDGSVIPPNDFIPLAEEIGLVGEIGRVVLEKAVAETMRLSRATGHPMHVAVNVATDQLAPGLVEQVSDVLDRHGMPAERLSLEITESTLADRSERTRHVLAGLRALGVVVSLDDFGTGYSSLSYLATLPVDGLKIDRSFVSVMGTSRQGLMLSRMVVQLARSLDLVTVAEGVETIEQADLLRGMGCDFAQGYLYARPLPADQYEEFLRGPVQLLTLEP